MEETYKFILPSGVEAEVGRLKGRHQRLLTQSDGKPHNQKLSELLLDRVFAMGSLKKGAIDLQFLDRLLVADRKALLVNIRQFTFDFSDTFEFTWEYTDAAGKKCEHKLCENIVEGKFDFKPYSTQSDEYSAIERRFKVMLPREKIEVTMSLLDGTSEKIVGAMKKTEMSSHTSIKLRNPTYDHKGKTDIVPIAYNLDDADLVDLEALRKAIKEKEGDVYTEIMFEHPEADTKAAHEKNVVLDVLGTVAFFFPSEAI